MNAWMLIIECKKISVTLVWTMTPIRLLIRPPDSIDPKAWQKREFIDTFGRVTAFQFRFILCLFVCFEPKEQLRMQTSREYIGWLCLFIDTKTKNELETETDEAQRRNSYLNTRQFVCIYLFNRFGRLFVCLFACSFNYSNSFVLLFSFGFLSFSMSAIENYACASIAQNFTSIEKLL